MDNVSELKEKLARKNLEGIALDIDETLADSNTHWFQSMHKHYPLEDADINRVMAEYKFIEEVPGWGTREAYAHMESLMHSEEFNETVPLIENANHTVNSIHKILPVLAYITARPQTVIDATKRWLDKHGFPHAEIICRPSDTKATHTDLNDRNAWKAQVLTKLYPQISGIIDDNKGLAHELQKLNYKGVLYLYGKESDEFSNNRHVVVCPTWNSVLENINAR